MLSNGVDRYIQVFGHPFLVLYQVLVLHSNNQQISQRSSRQKSKVKIIPAKNITASQKVVENSSTSVVDGMDEYKQLKSKLLVLTLAVGAIIGLAVWFWYGWKIFLSYAIGALVGTVYFRMLTKSVDRLGGESNRLGFTRLGLFVLLIAIAAKSEQLEILPAFFGFMTYKVAVLVIVAQDLSKS